MVRAFAIDYFDLKIPADSTEALEKLEGAMNEVGPLRARLMHKKQKVNRLRKVMEGRVAKGEIQVLSKNHQWFNRLESRWDKMYWWSGLDQILL